jgi:hypothetical protein
MSDWKYVRQDSTEALARQHFFSVGKKHSSGEIETRITVREFATPDIELNQKTAKFQPSGWSDTLMAALSECLKNLRRFECQVRVRRPRAD